MQSQSILLIWKFSWILYFWFVGREALNVFERHIGQLRRMIAFVILACLPESNRHSSLQKTLRISSLLQVPVQLAELQEHGMMN